MEGQYFEDLKVGVKFSSGGRTVTETDIVNFVALSGIYEQLFINKEYIEKETIFKKRIAPGPLTFSVAQGLAVQLGWLHGTVMAFLGIDEMRIPKPVFCNDTIYLDIEITEKKESRQPDRGIVTSRQVVRNQHGETVMHYNHTVMLRRRQPGKET